MFDPTTTVKIPAVTKQDEKEYVLCKNEDAMKKMIANPTPENRAAFEEANRLLWETLDAYKVAARLLLERAIKPRRITLRDFPDRR